MSSTQSQLKQAIGLILHYLSYRNRSLRELTDYLQKKKFAEETISAAIGYAQENGLIDDTAFSSDWIQMRLRQGKGDLIIRNELRQKGVSNEEIVSLLKAVPAEDFISGMAAVLAKKRVPPGDRLLVRKTLYQRGFSSNYIDLFLQHRVQ